MLLLYTRGSIGCACDLRKQNDPTPPETPLQKTESDEVSVSETSTIAPPEAVIAAPTVSQTVYSLPIPNVFFHPPLLDTFWNVFLHSGRRGVGKNTPTHAVDVPPPIPAVDAPSSTISKAEEDMPPFEEWRQQKLVEKEKSGAGNNGTGKRRPRTMKNTNYASIACGAKVIAHNAEAENPGAILSSSRDEYMLNPCKARKYFVVELCESIHVHGFDIGNMELFSNIPRQIQVSASVRFPTRDWIDLGRYDMKESRTIQNFSVAVKSGFVKYVRVEMLEHYGKEHYCPISLFRLFGTSMVEEYENSVDDDDDDGSGHETGVDEDAYMEQDKWGQDTLSTGGFGNGITDLVVNFVKKVSSSGYSLLKGNAKNSTPAPCRNATAIISALHSNDTEHGDTSPHDSRIAPNSPLLRLCFSTSKGWDATTPTCQYIWCLLQASNSTLSFCPLSPDNSNPVFQFSTPEVFECEETMPKLPNEIGVAVPSPAAHNHHETTPEAPAATVPVSTVPITTGESQIAPAKEIISENASGTAAETVPEITKANAEDLKNVSDEKVEKRNVNATVINMAVPVQPPVNATPGQKESVFVRLGNRLKTLELNMSLSGQYLHELSRRFKKQGEESARNFTVVFTKVTEITKSTADSQNELNRRVQQLEARNKYLEQALQDTESTLWMLRLVLPAVILCVILVSVICFIVGFYLLRRYVLRAVIDDISKRLIVHQNGYANGAVASSSRRPNGLVKHRQKVVVRPEMNADDAVVPG
ncbi:SUN domain-containing ossification factor-like [Paramacrobiotus metropolitanus]|uniref:SUN domain-containing ossification factor-like n=1 Tax=Paramacrobiotus metropolitanus TaxID=2943436 RepID=UPI0024463701|nr:SUN domain-containing ossification factor-like [Paramacrobiotus metropolitanus]